jgi:hypothetical protein
MMLLGGYTENDYGEFPMHSPATAFMLWGIPYEDVTWGIYQVDRLLDPTFVGTTHGQWAYVQTKTRTATLNRQPDTATGLDLGYPYGNMFWQPADGVTRQVFKDAPGYYCQTGNVLAYPFDYEYSGTFALYVFYIPPASSAGNSVPIPVASKSWKAKGFCSVDTAGVWTESDTGSGFYGATTNYPPFPSW